ncbi:MAG: GNAT family N-acetyltransferase [Burkholderiales bacterium]|nr:GNAT family N-acetyltransferase [Phycisphaerae bacterium]
MQLEVLSGAAASNAIHLLSLFDRARATFCALGLETVPTDLGTAICSCELLPIYDANALFDARLPAGLEMKTAWEGIESAFRDRQTHCLQVRVNLTALPAEREPVIAWLLQAGWREYRRNVYRLMAAPAMVNTGLIIISARAAVREYEQFARRAAGSQPRLADASLLRLDDPRYEVLVLLMDGAIVARAGVLTLGEVGLIEQVHVLGDQRGRGFGFAVIQHAIDLCARAQFKHVLLGCDSTNVAAIKLYASLGFAKIGESAEWRAPSTFA